MAKEDSNRNLRVLAESLCSIPVQMTDKENAEATRMLLTCTDLALAMDVSTNPDALIRLGQGLEKIAPKLSGNGDRTIVRQVIAQNLSSIQTTRSPIVIAQLARI